MDYFQKKKEKDDSTFKKNKFIKENIPSGKTQDIGL